MKRLLSNVLMYLIAGATALAIMVLAGPYIGVWTLYWLVRLHG